MISLKSWEIIILGELSGVTLSPDWLGANNVKEFEQWYDGVFFVILQKDDTISGDKKNLLI